MANWYRQGTVSVQNGSNILNFTGADLINSNAVFAGYQFIGPDGKGYEIASLVSGNQATIVGNYLGASMNDQPYAIIPILGGYSAEINRQLADLITGYQGVKDNAGTGKFAAGTAAAPGVRGITDTDTGLHWKSPDVLALIAGGQEIAGVNTDGMYASNYTGKGSAGNTVYSGGSGPGLGSNIIMYAEADPNSGLIIFRNGSTEIMRMSAGALEPRSSGTMNFGSPNNPIKSMYVNNTFEMFGQTIIHQPAAGVTPYFDVKRTQAGGLTGGAWGGISRHFIEDSAGSNINAATYGIWAADRTTAAMTAYHRFYAIDGGVYKEVFQIKGDKVLVNNVDLDVAGGAVLVGTPTVGSDGKNMQGDIFSSYRATATTAVHAQFHNPNGLVGSISTDGTSAIYSTASDYRLKFGFEALVVHNLPLSDRIAAALSDSATACDRLLAYNPGSFWWHGQDQNADNKTHGFLAHEYGAICHNGATGSKDGMKEEILTPALGTLTQTIMHEFVPRPSTLADGQTFTETHPADEAADLPAYGTLTAVQVVTDVPEPASMEEGDTWVETTPAVTEMVPDYQGIDQAKAVPDLVAAVQELIYENRSLKDRIEALESA